MSESTETPLSIFIIGPSSTGKTTLCEALVESLSIPQEAYVTEVARTIMKEKGYSRNTIGVLDMQKDIMEGYYTRQRNLEQLGEKYPIHLYDRSVIDPVVYAMLTAPNDDEANNRKDLLTRTPAFRNAVDKFKQSIMVLMRPVEGWLVDDGIRSVDNQLECINTFESLLEEWEIPYVSMGDEIQSLTRRVAKMEGIIKERSL
ncbi:AAA domain-containing protein [Panaeolus papilionaceus]|nr:AAA domain-containing protein [Panaeolus papilionaceus]